MSIHLKKILAVSASLLMVMSMGSTFNVNASRHSRTHVVYHHKNRSAHTYYILGHPATFQQVKQQAQHFHIPVKQFMKNATNDGKPVKRYEIYGEILYLSHDQLLKKAYMGTNMPTRQALHTNKRIISYFLKHCSNNGKPIKKYFIMGHYEYLSRQQLKQKANQEGISIPTFFYEFGRKATGYMTLKSNAHNHAAIMRGFHLFRKRFSKVRHSKHFKTPRQKILDHIDKDLDVARINSTKCKDNGYASKKAISNGKKAVAAINDANKTLNNNRKKLGISSYATTKSDMKYDISNDDLYLAAQVVVIKNQQLIKHARETGNQYGHLHYYEAPLTPAGAYKYFSKLNHNQKSHHYKSHVHKSHIRKSYRQIKHINRSHYAPVRQRSHGMSRHARAMFDQAIVSREYDDINQDRENNGDSALTLSNPLNQIALERAKQIMKVYGHFDPNNNNVGYAVEDANQLGDAHDQHGIEDWSNAENLNEAYSGSPNSIADQMNNGFMYHDASSGWGHRKNILNPDFNYVGLAVNYDKNSSDGVPYKLAEDFSSNLYY